jgi:hypothetical protein
MFYLKTFEEQGMEHPLMWYKTRRVCFEEELGKCIPASQSLSVLPCLANPSFPTPCPVSFWNSGALPYRLERRSSPACHVCTFIYLFRQRPISAYSTGQCRSLAATGVYPISIALKGSIALFLYNCSERINETKYQRYFSNGRCRSPLGRARMLSFNESPLHCYEGFLRSLASVAMYIVNGSLSPGTLTGHA